MAKLNFEGLQYYHNKLVEWITSRHDDTKTANEAQTRDGVIYFTTDTKQIFKDGVAYGGSIEAEDVEQTPDSAELTMTAVTPIVDYRSNSGTSFTIQPNKKYLFGTKSTLTISFATPSDTSVVNSYYFEFTSGSTATTLSMPSSVKWDATPSINPNKTYQIHIENNLGLIHEW